jgi:hypothetical protein
MTKSSNTNNGYSNEKDENSGYKSSKTKQGNYEDGYQENIYDRTNLLDTTYTDSSSCANPQSQLEL